MAKNDVKILFLLVAVLMAASSAVFSQARKTNKKSSAKPQTVQRAKQSVNKTINSAGWKTVLIEKWGIESLSLPAKFVGEKESIVPEKNKDISWIYYSRNWTKPAGKRVLPFEVNFHITTWDVDFTKITGLEPELATPENLLRHDHLYDEKAKTDGADPIIEEVKYLEIDGVRGSFYKSRHISDKRLVTAAWYTYRYYRNNAQKINFSVIAARSDLQEIMKILGSLKFQK